MKKYLLLLFLLAGYCQLHAQKFLIIERAGKAKTYKIFIGEMIEYKLYDSDEWTLAVIEDLLIEQDLILLGNRTVALKDIQKIRYQRRWTRAFGTSLFWFGAGWSGFALVGTATDGDPSTKYRWSDAIVTGASWFLAWAVPKIFKYKTFRFGKRKRLRMLDISIEKPKA